MKTFSELNELADTISGGYESQTITDLTIRQTLGFFAEVNILVNSMLIPAWSTYSRTDRLTFV